MPTLAELYATPKPKPPRLGNPLGEFNSALPEPSYTTPSLPAPQLPENSPGLIAATGRTIGGGLGAVGNILDLPGSSVRDLLGGKNPLDQWMDPLGYRAEENRTTGRELLRNYGMVGDEDTYKNWWGGFAGEVLLDPLTYTGIGALGKAGKIAGKATGQGAAKGVNILKDARRVANETAEQLAKAEAKAGGKSATMKRVMRGVGSRTRMTSRDVIKAQATPEARDDLLKAWYSAGGTEAMLDMPLSSIVSFKIPKLIDKEATILSKAAKDDLLKRNADETAGVLDGTRVRQTSFDALDDAPNPARAEVESVFNDWVRRNYDEVEAVPDPTPRAVPSQGLDDPPLGGAGGGGSTPTPGGTPTTGAGGPEATSALDVKRNKKNGVNFLATSKAFRGLSQNHEAFDTRLQELGDLGALGSEDRFLLQTAFADSDLGFAQNLTGVDAIDKSIGVGSFNPKNYRLALATGLKPGQQSSVLSHELGHMAYFALQRSDTDLFAAANKQLSESIADGSMLKYFENTHKGVDTEKLGMSMAEYLQQNPSEVFAQLVADKAAGRMDKAAKQVKLGGPIVGAVNKAWDYIARTMKRIVRATPAGDERHDAIQRLVDYATGFGGQQRDELLDILNGVKVADEIAPSVRFKTKEGAQATLRTMVERAGARAGLNWDNELFAESLSKAAEVVKDGDKYKVKIDADWFTKTLGSKEYQKKQIKRQIEEAVDSGNSSRADELVQQLGDLDAQNLPMSKPAWTQAADGTYSTVMDTGNATAQARIQARQDGTSELLLDSLVRTPDAPRGSGKAALRALADSAQEMGVDSLTGSFPDQRSLGALGAEFGKDNITFKTLEGVPANVDFATAMKSPQDYIATAKIVADDTDIRFMAEGKEAEAKRRFGDWWKENVPENTVSAVADFIDRGGDLFYSVPAFANMAALFRPELYGATTETGRQFGRARAEAVKTAIDQYREAVAPVVRSVHESKLFDIRKMIDEDKLSEEAAIGVANKNSTAIKNYVEGLVTAQELGDKFDLIRPQLDVMKLELEAARKRLEDAGLRAPVLDDLFISGENYLPRQRVTGSKSGGSATMNPKIGSVVETQTRSMVTRKFRDIPGGTAVIDEMSIDKNLSGLRNRANFIQKKLTDEDLATPIKMGDGTTRSLRQYIAEEYGDRLFKNYDATRFDPKSNQFDEWIRTLGDLDEVYANEQVPLFGRNPVADISRHLEDSIRVSKLVDNTLQMFGKSAVHMKYSPNPASVVSIPESLKLLGDKWNDTAKINIIKSMDKPIQDAYHVALESSVSDDLARLQKGEKIRRKVDGKDVSLQLKDDGTIVKYGTKIERKATPTGIEKTELPFEVAVSEDYVYKFAQGEVAEDFLSEFGVDSRIAEDASKFMKPFTQPEAVGAIEEGMRRYINVMKAGLTGPWPAFHVRNALSAFYMNAVLGANDPRFKGASVWRRFTEPYKDAYRLRTGQSIPDIEKIPGLEGANKEQALANEVFSMGIMGSKVGIAAEQIADEVEDFATQMPGLNKNINPMKGIAAAATLGKSSLGDPSKYFSKAPIGRTWVDFFNPIANRGGITLDVPKKDPSAGVETLLDQAKGAKVKRVDDDLFAGVHYGRDVASFVEEMSRVSQYIAARRNGYAPEAARDLVNKLQVDYSNLSAFEAKKMRLFIPFYSYSRAVLPVVVEDLINNPGGITAGVIKAANRSRDPDEVVPDHIAQTAALPLGETSDGSKRYLTGFGLPFEDTLNLLNGPLRGSLTDTLREIGGRSNPFIKGAAEQMFGRSLFQDGPMGGRELADLDPTVGRTISNVKDMATGTKTEKAEPFPSQFGEFLVANSPLSRFASTARTLTDSRKWENPVTGLGLNLLTGARVNDVSPQAQDSILNDRLARALKDMGGRTYSRPYVSDSREATMTDEEKKLSQELLEGIKRIQQRFKMRREEREKAEATSGEE